MPKLSQIESDDGSRIRDRERVCFHKGKVYGTILNMLSSTSNTRRRVL
jgi:hypothetical protein